MCFRSGLERRHVARTIDKLEHWPCPASGVHPTRDHRPAWIVCSRPPPSRTQACAPDVDDRANRCGNRQADELPLLGSWRQAKQSTMRHIEPRIWSTGQLVQAMCPMDHPMKMACWMRRHRGRTPKLFSDYFLGIFTLILVAGRRFYNCHSRQNHPEFQFNSRVRFARRGVRRLKSKLQQSRTVPSICKKRDMRRLRRNIAHMPKRQFISWLLART